MPRASSLVLLLAFALALGGCGRKPREESATASKLDPVLKARGEKDLAFRAGKDSPLREEDKRTFRALDYYPLNPELRFPVKLRRYPQPLAFRMATNTGEERPALRYGYFEFTVRGEVRRLQVYKVFDINETGGAYLFVPFRDATSAKETYGGGRYIDLEENTSGTYDLDFNRAYNPSCAYGKDYSCPVPPPENTLRVPIHAGEKAYRLPGH